MMTRGVLCLLYKYDPHCLLILLHMYSIQPVSDHARFSACIVTFKASFLVG
jgi:hypothetical protein